MAAFLPLIVLVKSRSNYMGMPKIIALVVASLYVVAFIFFFVADEEHDAEWEESLFTCTIGLIFWLAISLGLIWWGDELGGGLIGAKYGLISLPSPGWAVKLMGWILLLLPGFIVVFLWIRRH